MERVVQSRCPSGKVVPNPCPCGRQWKFHHQASLECPPALSFRLSAHPLPYKKQPGLTALFRDVPAGHFFPRPAGHGGDQLRFSLRIGIPVEFELLFQGTLEGGVPFRLIRMRGQVIPEVQFILIPAGPHMQMERLPPEAVRGIALHQNQAHLRFVPVHFPVAALFQQGKRFKNK